MINNAINLFSYLIATADIVFFCYRQSLCIKDGLLVVFLVIDLILWKCANLCRQAKVKNAEYPLNKEQKTDVMSPYLCAIILFGSALRLYFAYKNNVFPTSDTGVFYKEICALANGEPIETKSLRQVFFQYRW